MTQQTERRSTIGVHIQLPLSVSIELDRLKTDNLEKGKRTSKQMLIVDSVKAMLNESYQLNQSEL
jgi:autotransporter translocation and assembly factor TamB